MSYGKFLLLACTPLLGLTAFTLLRPANSAATADADHPSDGDQVIVEAAQELASATESRLQGDEAFLRELAVAELFEKPSHDSFSKPISSSLVHVAVDWQAALPMLDLLAKIEKLPLGRLVFPDHGDSKDWFQSLDTQLDARIRAIDDFLKDDAPKFKDKGGGAARIIAAIEARIAEFRAEKEVCAKLLEARQRWEDKDYQHFLGAIEQVRIENVRDDRCREWVDKRIQDGRSMARFWIDWQEIDRLVGRNALDRLDLAQVNVLLAAVAQFLQKHPSPPGELAPVKRDAIVQVRDALTRRKTMLETTQRLDADLVRLGQARNLNEAEQVAKDIQKSYPEPNETGREAARNKLSQWIRDRAFPKKVSPERLNGMEEATDTNHHRLLGKFARIPGRLNTDFWPWDKAQNGTEPKKIAREVESHRPKYVQWADDYNGRVERLRRNASKGQWLEFFTWCAQTQETIKKYQDEVRQLEDWTELDQGCEAWSRSFLADKDIVPQDDLTELSERFDRLQLVFGR